jgi:accessory colonization factor AcfC
MQSIKNSTAAFSMTSSSGAYIRKSITIVIRNNSKNKNIKNIRFINKKFIYFKILLNLKFVFFFII